MTESNHRLVDRLADGKDAVHPGEHEHIGDSLIQPANQQFAPFRHALQQREEGAQPATVDELHPGQIEDQGNWPIGEITTDGFFEGLRLVRNQARLNHLQHYVRSYLLLYDPHSDPLFLQVKKVPFIVESLVSHRLDPPDIFRVFRNRPVAGEFPTARHIQDGFRGPPWNVLETTAHSLLGGHIGIEIRQVEVGIAPVKQRVNDWLKQSGLIGRERSSLRASNTRRIPGLA